MPCVAILFIYMFKPVLENVWKFGFRIAEAKLPFAENAEKFS
jgi:hypothetical protein